MSALSGASVPVPKMYLFCEDKTVMGQEFYVMEYIKVQLSTFDFRLSIIISPNLKRGRYPW